jgi:hypothetical protein
MSDGHARPDRLAFRAYWGKLTVRNFMEGDGNVGIIRSPVRAIAIPDLYFHERQADLRDIKWILC